MSYAGLVVSFGGLVLIFFGAAMKSRNGSWLVMIGGLTMLGAVVLL